MWLQSSQFCWAAKHHNMSHVLSKWCLLAREYMCMQLSHTNVFSGHGA